MSYILGPTPSRSLTSPGLESRNPILAPIPTPHVLHFLNRLHPQLKTSVSSRVLTSPNSYSKSAFLAPKDSNLLLHLVSWTLSPPTPLPWVKNPSSVVFPVFLGFGAKIRFTRTAAHTTECKPGPHSWQAAVPQGFSGKERKEEATGHESGKFLDSQRDGPHSPAKSARVKGQLVSLQMSHSRDGKRFRNTSSQGKGQDVT